MNALAPILANALALVQEPAGYAVSPRVAPAPSGVSFSDGGLMMYPLTFCAIAVVALAGVSAWRIWSDSPDATSSARAGIDGVLFWGVYASILGVLGTVVGITLAAMAVEAVGAVEVRLVSGGIKVALITTIYGLVVLLGAALLWFGLTVWHRRAVLTGA